MKFLVDAQLPYKLKKWLSNQGFDTIHTSDLALKNLSSDNFISTLATQQDRIVISKDSDFFSLHLIHGSPKQLLMITTGNIANKTLIQLFEANFPTIKKLFENGSNVVEIDNISIVVHE